VGWGYRTGYSANGQRWLNRVYDNAAIGFRQLKLKWHNRNKDRMVPQGVIARVGVDVRRSSDLRSRSETSLSLASCSKMR
jgi:hypothetical protein